jgi:hypothetical protein
MTIAKLFARLGIKADNKKAKDFKKSLENVAKTLTVATGAAIAFSIGIKKITDEAFNSALAMKQFEAETGASMEELQKWQAVAELTNNSAEAVTQSIKAIALNQEKIKLGQGNISGYQLLGIDPRQDPFKILEKLREKTTGLNQAMKKNIIGQMGLSSELIQILDLTNDEFDRMYKSAFVIPKSQIDIMDKARSSIAFLNQGIRWLKTQIAVELAPEILKLNKVLIEWIKNNKEGVVKTVKEIFIWLKKYTGAVINAIKMINIIIKGTIGWKNALYVLIGVLALLNASLIASPIGLLVAGIVLLIAVLDDLYIYSSGKGESLFGNMMKKYPELEKKLLGSIKTIKEIVQAFSEIWKGEENMDNLIEKWGVWAKVLKGIATSLKIITGEKDFFETILGKKTYEKATSAIQKMFFKPEISLANPGGKGQSLVNNNNNYNIKMDINTTSGNPEEIADRVDKRLQKSINSASNQRIRNE